MPDQKWRQCRGCPAQFLVPGDRGPSAEFCSRACMQRSVNVITRRALAELRRRHQDEYDKIRAKIREDQEYPRICGIS